MTFRDARITVLGTAAVIAAAALLVILTPRPDPDPQPTTQPDPEVIYIFVSGPCDHDFYVPPIIEYAELLDLIHLRESSRGTDPDCKRGIVGPAGERGEFQLTPPFTEEIERLGGGSVDVYDNASCRRAIMLWMNYWAHRVKAVSLEDKYELYRRGPTGFRQWRKGD